MSNRSIVSLLSLAALLVPAVVGATTAPADSSMQLRAQEKVTNLDHLRVEADNQVQIRFERPQLDVQVDPSTAPGLSWGSILDVLDREQPDLVSSALATSAGELNPRLARPWLDGFRSGTVARFRPNVDGASSWSMAIADSRGTSVRTFAGSGKPPEEIAWDGRRDDGSIAPVGLTYSYVLTATDRAGNKRNFVGDGFELPAYRTGIDEDPRFLFTGAQLEPSAPAPMLLVEVASRINRISAVQRAVEVRVSARTSADAESLAKKIAGWLEPRLVDGPRRVLTTIDVAPDAPAAGGVMISLRP